MAIKIPDSGSIPGAHGFDLGDTVGLGILSNMAAWCDYLPVHFGMHPGIIGTWTSKSAQIRACPIIESTGCIGDSLKVGLLWALASCFFHRDRLLARSSNQITSTRPLFA